MITEEEREARREGMGSSDIYYILGNKDNFSNEQDIWAEKVGVREDRSSSFAADCGNMMEPVIAEHYVRPFALDNCLGDDLVEPKRLSHPEMGIVFANADRVILDEEGRWTEIFEIKFVGHYRGREFGENWSEDYPKKFRYQMLWQMLVARANGYPVEKVHLCAMISNERIFWTELYWDEKEAKDVLDRCVSWWNTHVVPHQLPLVDGEKEDLAALERILGSLPDGGEVEADESIAAIAKQLHDAEKRFLEAGEEITRCKVQIMQFMGESTRLVGDNFEVLNKPTKARRTTSWKSLAQTFKPSQALIDEHTKVGEVKRRFKFTYNTGGNYGY